MTVLETPRLVLREVIPSDVEALSEAYCDAFNMRFFPKPFSRDDVVDLVTRLLDRYRRDGVGKWAVVMKDTGEIAGDCGLLLQQVEGVEETEVAYVFARRFQGQGYATEAARASMRYAFDQLGSSRVISLIAPSNVPSRKVAGRNGMVLEKETLFHNLPHLIYAAHRGNALI